MSDPLADNTEEVKAIKTVDDCFEKVEGYNMESLKYPNQLKEMFPDFAKKLGESLKDKPERQKGQKLDEVASEIDGRKYWKSVFNGVMNYNRTMPGTGGGSKGPSGVTIYKTINVATANPETITQLMTQNPKEGVFKKISFIDRNPGTGKHEYVVETYEVIKYFPTAGASQTQTQEEKKE